MLKLKCLVPSDPFGRICTYLVLILGAALAAASTTWFFLQNDIHVRAPTSESAHAYEQLAN